MMDAPIYGSGSAGNRHDRLVCECLLSGDVIAPFAVAGLLSNAFFAGHNKTFQLESL